jgi:hypothetical protein
VCSQGIVTLLNRILPEATGLGRRRTLTRGLVLHRCRLTLWIENLEDASGLRCRWVLGPLGSGTAAGDTSHYYMQETGACSSICCGAFLGVFSVLGGSGGTSTNTAKGQSHDYSRLWRDEWECTSHASCPVNLGIFSS